MQSVRGAYGKNKWVACLFVACLMLSACGSPAFSGNPFQRAGGGQTDPDKPDTQTHRIPYKTLLEVVLGEDADKKAFAFENAVKMESDESVLDLEDSRNFLTLTKAPALPGFDFYDPDRSINDWFMDTTSDKIYAMGGSASFTHSTQVILRKEGDDSASPFAQFTKHTVFGYQGRSYAYLFRNAPQGEEEGALRLALSIGVPWHQIVRDESEKQKNDETLILVDPLGLNNWQNIIFELKDNEAFRTLFSVEDSQMVGGEKNTGEKKTEGELYARRLREGGYNSILPQVSFSSAVIERYHPTGDESYHDYDLSRETHSVMFSSLGEGENVFFRPFKYGFLLFGSYVKISQARSGGLPDLRFARGGFGLALGSLSKQSLSMARYSGRTQSQSYTQGDVSVAFSGGGRAIDLREKALHGKITLEVDRDTNGPYVQNVSIEQSEPLERRADEEGKYVLPTTINPMATEFNFTFKSEGKGLIGLSQDGSPFSIKLIADESKKSFVNLAGQLAVVDESLFIGGYGFLNGAFYGPDNDYVAGVWSFRKETSSESGSGVALIGVYAMPKEVAP